jgi:predicted RNase H-like HicB family nuclease
MAVHEEVLTAARRICRARGGWTFTAEEIVRALPHLNEHSVRAHVASRCCVNAPAHHTHRYGYFRRIGRGRYEIVRIHRGGRESRIEADRGRTVRSTPVAETRLPYRAPSPTPVRDTIHAVLTRDGAYYVAECLEVAVVTQGRTADETLSNLEEAIGLHLEGEDPRSFGLSDNPRLVVTYEAPRAGRGSRA